MSESAFRPESLDIVLVEDHPDTRKLLHAFLERSGHRVRTARSVASAVELLRDAPCEVLLSDVGLPDGRGWEIPERVALPRETFAIAMSGFGQGEDEARSLAAGFRHHLRKPFLPEHLVELLTEALTEKQTRSNAMHQTAH